jgi:hypothetical protein
MTEDLRQAAHERHHGHFSEGLDDRERFPEDERVGRSARAKSGVPTTTGNIGMGASARARRCSPRRTLPVPLYNRAAARSAPAAAPRYWLRARVHSA